MTAQFRLTHPSRKRLLDWLNHDAAPQLTQHVEQCDRCAATLEALADQPESAQLAMPAELGAAIREVFTPPADLHERVLLRISERERAQQEMSLLFGLISISKDVAELMMPADDGAASPSSPRSNVDDYGDAGMGTTA